MGGWGKHIHTCIWGVVLETLGERILKHSFCVSVMPRLNYYSSIQSVLTVRPILLFPHSQAHHPYMNLVYIYVQVILCTRRGNGNPFQDSCLGYPMDRRDWWATIHGIAEKSHRRVRHV